MDPAKEKPKVLIVDDKPQNLYVLDKLLSGIAVDVIQTTSGTKALGLALEHDFCLAIVDVQMPEMDGYELVELLRGNQTTASLPIIFVSAIYSDEYHHRKGYDAGAVDFLSKPFVPEILLSKVKVFLDLYYQRMRLQELVNELHTKNKVLTQVTEELRDANTELARQAVQLEATNQVGQQVTSLLEPTELLRQVVALIQSQFAYYFVSVWLPDEANEAMMLEAGAGSGAVSLLEPGFRVPLYSSHSIIVSVYQTGELYLAEDVCEDEQYMAVDALPAVRSELALPLRVGQEKIGVLDIQSEQVTGFSKRDQQVLQTMANQIAIAIRNARLYTSEKELRSIEAERVHELAELNATKDKLFSIISHDLRTPFNGLLGGTGLLLMEAERMTRAEIVEYSMMLNRSAQAAYNLLQNLLTWSRLQRGNISFDPHMIQLRKLAQDTIGLLSKTAVTKGVALTNAIADDLVAYGDINMLDLIIRNLTSNAIKFTPHGGTVTIQAQMMANGDAPYVNGASEVIRVSVTDTGIGIAPQDMDKLFRLDTHHTTPGTNDEEGTGLGLIICQEMVERNGGHIWAESEVGKGTSFHFILPAAAENA